MGCGEKTRVIGGELLAECVYGWGHVLRLYPEYLEIRDRLYALSDLINFKPSYRRFLGVSSMRLELQFVSGTIVVRGMSDIGSALKLINYLNVRNDAQLASVPELSSPLSFPAVAQPLSSLPEIDERYRQHDERLQRLQVEREIRFYGFDAAALAKRLRDETLEPIAVAVPLHDDEVAHYRTEARLFDEFSDDKKHARSKAKDQGTLILTNQRMIYLGQKRHIMLGYERILQVEQIKGALILSTEYWKRKQFFCMQHPLECAMYLEHALHSFQQLLPLTYVQTQAFDMPSQSSLLIASHALEESNVSD